jgi:hypothetical protein
MNNKKTWDFHMRMTKEQKERIVFLAKSSGFNIISEYVRFVILNPSFDEKLNRILEVVKDLQEKLITAQNQDSRH